MIPKSKHGFAIRERVKRGELAPGAVLAGVANGEFEIPMKLGIWLVGTGRRRYKEARERMKRVANDNHKTK